MKKEIYSNDCENSEPINVGDFVYVHRNSPQKSDPTYLDISYYRVEEVIAINFNKMEITTHIDCKFMSMETVIGKENLVFKHKEQIEKTLSILKLQKA